MLSALTTHPFIANVVSTRLQGTDAQVKSEYKLGTFLRCSDVALCHTQQLI